MWKQYITRIGYSLYTAGFVGNADHWEFFWGRKRIGVHTNMQSIDKKCILVPFPPSQGFSAETTCKWWLTPSWQKNSRHPAWPVQADGFTPHECPARSGPHQLQRVRYVARSLLQQWRCWQQHSRRQLNEREQIWKFNKFNALVKQHIKAMTY